MSNFKAVSLCVPLLLGFFFCLSCATGEPPQPPVPPQAPGVSLAFDRVEAEEPGRLSLHFLLSVENLRSSGARIRLREWRALLNGGAPEEGVFLDFEPQDTLLAAHASRTFPVRLDLVLADIPGSGTLKQEEYRAGLSLDLGFIFDSGESLRVLASAEALFPPIREPEFIITAIAVKKAELINTRFKVNLRVENPNYFPVELSALNYELYGGGRFWADGQEQDILYIPPGGAAETELFLVMNFINMRRDLLDQVIALKQVRYRFTGEATVSTGIHYLPRFRTHFDRSGNSVVIE
ncbi:MAG: LEA type 2 family protein [Treponema sp.]|nr:LEA type 2 family protein [Treponema sp.]